MAVYCCRQQYNVLRSSCRIPDIFDWLETNLNFRDMFSSKSPRSNFIEILSVGAALIHAEGWKDRRNVNNRRSSWLWKCHQTVKSGASFFPSSMGYLSVASLWLNYIKKYPGETWVSGCYMKIRLALFFVSVCSSPWNNVTITSQSYVGLGSFALLTHAVNEIATHCMSHLNSFI